MQSWPNLKYYPGNGWKDWRKPHITSATAASLWVKIWMQNNPNIKQECLLTSLQCSVCLILQKYKHPATMGELMETDKTCKCISMKHTASVLFRSVDLNSRWLSSGIRCCVVWQKFNDISGIPAFPIHPEDANFSKFLPCSWAPHPRSEQCSNHQCENIKPCITWTVFLLPCQNAPTGTKEKFQIFLF